MTQSKESDESIYAEFDALTEEVSPTLPLVEMVVDMFKDEEPLKDWTGLLFQHQLGTTVAMVQGMQDLGLNLKDTWWVDIPYTSHKEVRDAVVTMGMPWDHFMTSQKSAPVSRHFAPQEPYEILAPYAPYQRNRAFEMYEFLCRDPEKKLLVIDDGAYFLEAASCFGDNLDHVRVVEQTGRGYKKMWANAAMREAASRCVVVDVARSIGKTQCESPFIGAAVCYSLRKKLEDARGSGFKELEYLILGFGNIGSAVARYLRDIIGVKVKRVHICDPRVNDTDKFPQWNRDKFRRFDVVIGCSGESSWDVGDFVFLNDEAILTSASSGAVELNRRNIIEWAAVSPNDPLHIEESELSGETIHQAISINLPRAPGSTDDKQRKVSILNGGFPINFDGRVNCMPDCMIDLSMAQMVLAAVIATKTEQPGHVCLNGPRMKNLIEAFYEALEKKPYRHLLTESVEDVLAENDAPEKAPYPFKPFPIPNQELASGASSQAEEPDEGTMHAET